MGPILTWRWGVILHMAKPRSRASLEETGPQGSCCAGEGLDPCLSWASCGISRSGAQPMQGQHPCPCSISLSSLWYLLALLQDGHGHIWAHLGGGCPGAWSGVCSRLPSLLPSPPPILFPTLVHTWAHEDRERRWDFHWGGHITFLWGKHLGERQGSLSFLLSSYCNAFPTARPCPSSASNTTPMDNVQDLTLCAKESLAHLPLQGCQLTPPYLPPQL